MAYKKPGAYARFIRTAGAVNSPGATRVLALVGTGRLFFDSLSEAILRSAGSTSDTLANNNVSEIYEISSKPMKNGAPDPTATKYTKGTHFELMGNTIAWKTEPTSGDPKVEMTDGSVTTTEFSIVAAPSGSDSHLIKTGQYRIQISYIDTVGSNPATYAVIDDRSEIVLGEFTVSDSPISVNIPGVTLAVSASDIVGRKEGDFVYVKTTAGTLIAGTPPQDTIFYASYAYKKAESEFAPKVFTDYDSIVAEYGNYDVTASGKVINSLALGAEIAFVNGVQPLVLVQAKNDSDYEIKVAIDKLQRDIAGITNVNVIVPLTQSGVIAAHVMGHVDYMSSTEVGKERMAYVSAIDGETATASAANASSFNHERLIYVAPGAVIKEIKDVDTGRVSQRRIPGCFAAIAVAALGLRNDPAEPLTNKFISGFAGLGELYNESEKNLMAEKGVLVLEQSGFNIKVRHGITTSVAEVNSAEITLVQIKDYVIEAARTNLGTLYVGRKLMPTIVGDVQTTLTNILSQFISQEVIIGYEGVNVKRSPDDPRAIDVSFEIEAVYPLNYINISFSFSGVN